MTESCKRHRFRINKRDSSDACRAVLDPDTEFEFAAFIRKGESGLSSRHLQQGIGLVDGLFAKLFTVRRIEDDLLLLEDGAVNLSESIIKEADEIEAFMANNQ